MFPNILSFIICQLPIADVVISSPFNKYNGRFMTVNSPFAALVKITMVSAAINTSHLVGSSLKHLISLINSTTSTVAVTAPVRVSR